jgi:hypothetical protein
MSLRKSPTLTPALLAAIRQNSKKSTGPRTARGKAWSRQNSLRHGARSQEVWDLISALFNAPPGPARVAAMAQAILASKPVQPPLFVEFAELCIQAEIDLCPSNWRKSMLRKREEINIFRSK